MLSASPVEPVVGHAPAVLAPPQGSMIAATLLVEDDSPSPGIDGRARKSSARARSNAHDVVAVLGFTAIANLALYGSLTIVSHALTPSQYGLFSSIFNVIVLLGVIFTALQTFVASRIAGGGGTFSTDAVRSMLLRTCACGLGLFLAGASISPLFSRFVHSEDVTAPLAAAAVCAALLPWSALLGVYQGAGRFRSYGALSLAQALARLGACAILLVTTSVAVLLLAVAACVVFTTILGVRHLSDKSGDVAPTERPSVPGSRLAFAFTLLSVSAIGFPTVGDVILVRHVYGPGQSGIYAGVALLGRVVLFIPVAFNAVLFPRYVAAPWARSGRRLRTLGSLGVTVVAAPALFMFEVFPKLSLRLVAGPSYESGAALLRPYAVSAFVAGLASMYVLHELARGRRSYLAALLCPYIVAQIALPFVISADLHSLVLWGLAVNLAFFGAVALGECVTHRLPRFAVPA
jgi:O-antigen/teichoic acid export membrane protein